MRQTDWTPAVLITASLSLTVVVAVLLTSPLFPSPFEASPGPGHARRSLPPEVEVWVGELAPGLTGVLAPVWGQPGPDRAHDEQLNAELGLAPRVALGWYQLLVFNTSEREQRLALGAGALSIRGPTGPPAPLASLPALVARGEAVLPPALEAVLRARGTLEGQIALPPGTMADLLVPFAHRVDLEQAREVADAEGGAFRRRRMQRSELEGLVADPRLDRIEKL